MSLGAGYQYLMSSVVRGDGAVAAASPLTRYYAESGTPPGWFLGAGLAGLNNGDGVPLGSVVTEAGLFNLLGMLADPITGKPLGRAPRCWPASLSERVRQRIVEIPSDLDTAARTTAVSAIERDETERERRVSRPVAGFDLTFSVPKSVSAVWAVTDPTTQATIYEAHRDAIKIAIGYAERNIFFSRTGKNGAVQEDIRGVVAAAFDHWDSRAGDPHLHTHVVIANRAQTRDGAWRTLDSRTLFRYVVALSELHEGVLQDLLTARLGYEWDERVRQHSLVPRHDVAGVPDGLIAEFSRRSADIETVKNDLVEAFAQRNGRQPSASEVLRLRQRATLQTRPDKQYHSLQKQTETWRARARAHVGTDTVTWAQGLCERADSAALRHGDVEVEMWRELAQTALAEVSTRRTTFSHANVLAEVHRQLHGLYFATPMDRLAVADHTANLALEAALRLTPAAAQPIPSQLARPDGSSKLRHRGAERYTTKELMDAETRLLELGRRTDAPAVADSPVLAPHSDEQSAAVRAIATSGRVLDVLVGRPAPARLPRWARFAQPGRRATGKVR